MWRLSATVRHKNTKVSCTSQRSSSVWRDDVRTTQRAYRVLKIIKERILLLLPNMTNVSEMCLLHFSKTTTGKKENECDSPPSLLSRENTWTTYWAPVTGSTVGQKKVRTHQIALNPGLHVVRGKTESCSVQIKPSLSLFCKYKCPFQNIQGCVQSSQLIAYCISWWRSS